MGQGGRRKSADAASGGGTPVGQDEALARAAELIKSGKAKHIVVLTGAGISTSAGIPDFRSSSTGLYHNLARLNLPYPEAVFSLDFFEDRPERPFWALAKELYPGKHFPTPTHYFFKHLHNNDLLLRVFTQNIDTLESAAGLPPASVVEAHGSFATAHCLACRRAVDSEYVLRAGVRRGQVVRCECGGLVKPDIVFFGESLPEKFFKSLSDLTLCDFLIVIGTSLQVQPFASLVNYVRPTCPRLLINREAVGPFVRAGWKEGTRDGCWLGDCDEGVRRLCDLLGWEKELGRLVKEGRAELEKLWKRKEAEDEADRLEEEADASDAGEGEVRRDADRQSGDMGGDADKDGAGEEGDGQAEAARRAAKAADAVQAVERETDSARPGVVAESEAGGKSATPDGGPDGVVDAADKVKVVEADADADDDVEQLERAVERVIVE
ncbi:Sir2 histone deacetylase Hst2 [Cryptotrichosporon argae]